MKSHYTNNFYKKHHKNTFHKNHYTNVVVINQIDKHKVKYIITACIPKLLSKKIYFFSLLYIKINEKNINFNNKKIKKGEFYNKNKKIFNVDDINVNEILVSKKEKQ